MDILLVMGLFLVVMFGLLLSRGFTIKLLAKRGKETTAAITGTQKYNLASGGSHRRWRYEYFVDGKRYRGSSFLSLPDETINIRIVYDPVFPFLSAPYTVVEKVQKLYQQ